MMFERTLDLFLDITAAGGAARPLLASATSSSALTSRPVLVHGDALTLRLWLAVPAATLGAAPSFTTLDDGGRLVLAAKLSSALAGNALFSITEFTLIEPEGGNPFYQGALNLNTTDLATAMLNRTSPLVVLVDIEAQNADNTQRVTWQFEATVKPQVYRGTEGIPVSGNPPYPAPDQLVLKQADQAWYRFGTDGHVYLYHQPTGLWHTVQLQLVESTITLTVNPNGVANVP